MITQTPGLSAMRAFRRVVELRSFNAAARSLGITGGAVSKLVAQLERDLGVRLLQRSTRSVAVNAEGLRFYADAVQLLDALEAATESLRASTHSPSGRVRVSLPTSFALTWLSRRLPEFVESHPQIELDLVLNDRYVDIVQEGFDCAIRIASDLADSTLVARRLGSMQRMLVAAPGYLAAAPPLDHPKDLSMHACLLYSQDGGSVDWPFRGASPMRMSGYVRANNSAMLCELLVANLGVALAPDFVIADLLADGSLVELLPAHRPPPQGIFGVVSHARFPARGVDAFLDFVARGLGAQA